jgi:hypothetical protein
MTDRDVMDRVGVLLDRAVVPMDPREKHYKVPFVVSLKGVDAVRLMVSARSSLGTARRAQIEEALRDWGIGRTRWSYAGLTCAVDGCVQPATTKGLCDSHFNRWYKAMRRGASSPFTPRPLTREDVLREPSGHRPTPECEVAWLAGLLEGEGTFSRNRTESNSYPVLSVHMCSRDVVERAGVILGALSVQQRKPSDPSWNLTYRAAIGGLEAALWMQRLRPMMGERRRAAIDVALDDYYPERLSVAPEHCVVPGCEEPHRGRGLCHKHYMSWSRDRTKGRTPRVKPLRSN